MDDIAETDERVIWTFDSGGGSPRAIAHRFAGDAFEIPMKVDWPSFTLDENCSKELVRAHFRLVGDLKVWKLEGVPPGHWTVTEVVA